MLVGKSCGCIGEGSKVVRVGRGLRAFVSSNLVRRRPLGGTEVAWPRGPLRKTASTPRDVVGFLPFPLPFALQINRHDA